MSVVAIDSTEGRTGRTNSAAALVLSPLQTGKYVDVDHATRNELRLER